MMTLTQETRMEDRRKIHGYVGQIGDIRGAFRTTKAAAEAAAFEAAEAALTGDYAPRVLFHRGLIALLWREPQLGWMYYVGTPERIAMRAQQFGGKLLATTIASEDDADRVERRVRVHLAQNAYHPGDPAEAPDIIRDPTDRAEFAAWVRFQDAYRAAVDLGMSDPYDYAYCHSR